VGAVARAAGRRYTGVGSFALFEDLEGNVIGLMTAAF